MIECMVPGIKGFKREREKDSTSRLATEQYIRAEILPAYGLSHHVRQLQKRNKGSSHWFALAVILGAVMAIAFVGLLAR